MGAISMLALTLGGGAVLLSAIWVAVDGLKTENIRPGLVGLILVSVGLVLPLDSGSARATTAPSVSADPGPIANSVNLPTSPTLVARLGVACETDAAGRARCWGSDVPVPAGAVHRIVLGRAHGCALMQTGELSCWGAVEDSADTRSGHRFVDAASTLHTTCGLTAQGALHCFGRDLGMPPSGHRLTQITGGADHFCALTEAQHAFCWGRDTDGQLDAPADTRFQQLSAGHFHTCGITAEGLTTCWGRTTEGQSTPPATTTFTQLSAGWAHTCGLTASGEAVCWGCENRHRDLQIGDTDACSPPSSTFLAIAAGDLWQSCGLTPDGEVQCWGGIERQGVQR